MRKLAKKYSKVLMFIWGINNIFISKQISDLKKVSKQETKKKKTKQQEKKCKLYNLN